MPLENGAALADGTGPVPYVYRPELYPFKGLGPVTWGHPIDETSSPADIARHEAQLVARVNDAERDLKTAQRALRAFQLAQSQRPASPAGAARGLLNLPDLLRDLSEAGRALYFSELILRNADGRVVTPVLPQHRLGALAASLAASGGEMQLPFTYERARKVMQLHLKDIWVAPRDLPAALRVQARSA